MKFGCCVVPSSRGKRKRINQKRKDMLRKKKKERDSLLSFVNRVSRTEIVRDDTIVPKKKRRENFQDFILG